MLNKKSILIALILGLIILILPVVLYLFTTSSS
ncbi:flagellar basal body-associated protein FliL [Paenibacillus amylolyticus]|uniref:Flagellar basal body-associated protein FliL n=1 Tax=Paenibacillus amylolyticus TaxID=1451 RepID=A0AAP5H3J3_PAEAM|nr:flagellar basal body-associated protein FliL [Paenibacillus amylolyticus]